MWPTKGMPNLIFFHIVTNIFFSFVKVNSTLRCEISKVVFYALYINIYIYKDQENKSVVDIINRLNSKTRSTNVE